jgi:hypothetical protein
MFYTYILLPTEYWESINKYGPTQRQHSSVWRWSLTMTSRHLIPTMNPTPSPTVGPAWIQPAASYLNTVNFCFGRGGGHCYFSSSALKPSGSQTYFLTDPLFASKNNHRFSHPCSCQYIFSRWHVCKITNLYLKTDLRQILIHTSSITLQCIAWSDLIRLTVARFEGTVSFLIWYSNGCKK